MRSSDLTAQQDEGPGVKLVAALVVAVIGFAVQQTSVVPAIRVIQSSLGGATEWSAWLVTVYLVVATVATPALGRLADLHGRRRMLLVGLTIFAVSSVGAALAPSLLVLIVFRALQGVGGAVYPLTLALARQHTAEDRTQRVVGLLTGAFGVGTALGFVVGGVLAQYASWRYIFLVGAVIVAGGTALVARVLPPSQERAEGTFDVAGTAVLSVASTAVLVALTLVVQLGWSSPVIVAMFVVALVAAVGWVRLEACRSDPLIDVHVLRTRRVAVINVATIGLGWALFGSYLLVPRFASLPPGRAGFGLGWGAAATGLLLFPLAVGQTISGPAAGRVSQWVAPRMVFATGLLLVACALAALSVIRRDAVGVGVAAFVLGLGAGAGLEASSAVATQGVEADVAAVSSAFNSTVRRLAGGVGGQMNTILLASLAVTASLPRFSAFTVSYAVSAALCVLGAVAVAAAAPHGRPGRRSDRRRTARTR